MKCEVRKAGKVTLFSVQGDVIFNQMSEIREMVMGEIVHSSNGKFLLILGGVDLIDSSGVGFIISVYKTAVSRNGKFAIVCPKSDVTTVLQTVGLVPRLFNIYENEDEAIKAF